MRCSSTGTPALASANTGRMNSATGAASACSRRVAGEGVGARRNGIAKATSTPASVACTPERSISHHSSAPAIRYGVRARTLSSLLRPSIASHSASTPPSHGHASASL